MAGAKVKWRLKDQIIIGTAQTAWLIIIFVLKNAWLAALDLFSKIQLAISQNV